MLLPLLMALLLAAPENGEADPGISATRIVLGEPAAFSGPSAGLGTEMWRGAEAAFEESNGAGGVNGRMVSLVVADDAYDAEKAALAAFHLVSRDKVFALFGGVGTPTIIKALPVVLKYYQTQGLFYFANFTGAQPQREPPFGKAVFNVRASYREEARAIVGVFAALGKKRIGIFVQDDAYGASGRDAVRRALEPVGLSIAADTTYPRGQLYAQSTEPQLKLLRDASVDAIISVGSYQPCAALIRDARRSGLKVPIHNLSFVGADQLLHLLREEEQKTGQMLTANLVVTQVVPSYTDLGVPLIQRYRAAMEKLGRRQPPAGDGSYQPPGTFSFGSVEGYLSARVFLAVLEKTGAEVTRKSFYDAAEHMGRFDVGLGVPLEFTPARHQALSTVWFTVPSADGWRSVSDPLAVLR